MFMLMGAFVSRLGREPRAVPRRQRVDRPPARRPGHGHRRSPAAASPRSAARRSPPPRPSPPWPTPRCGATATRSRSPPASSPPAARSARCCRRRPCWRSTASSPAGHRQAVHGRHPARACWRCSMYMLTIVVIGCVRPELAAGRRRASPGRERLAGAEGRLGPAGAVRLRHRRPLRRLLHADRGRRRGRRRRLPARRAAPASSTAPASAPRCCRPRAPRRRCSPC